MLVVLALLSLLFEVIGRWKQRQRRARGAAPSSGASLPSPARTPGCWRSPLALVVVSLGLAALLLCALVPLEAAVFDTGGSISLGSVAMVSPDDGWAVGKHVGGVRGVIWRYHNGTWAPVSSPTEAGLHGVSVLPNGEAWAVGLNGTILHERGGQWA